MVHPERPSDRALRLARVQPCDDPAVPLTGEVAPHLTRCRAPPRLRHTAVVERPATAPYPRSPRCAPWPVRQPQGPARGTAHSVGARRTRHAQATPASHRRALGRRPTSALDRSGYCAERQARPDREAGRPPRQHHAPAGDRASASEPEPTRQRDRQAPGRTDRGETDACQAHDDPVPRPAARTRPREARGNLSRLVCHRDTRAPPRSRSPVACHRRSRRDAPVATGDPPTLRIARVGHADHRDPRRAPCCADSTERSRLGHHQPDVAPQHRPSAVVGSTRARSDAWTARTTRNARLRRRSALRVWPSPPLPQCERQRQERDPKECHLTPLRQGVRSRLGSW